MAKQQNFDVHEKSFPKEFRATLRTRRAFKEMLEADKRLKVPRRVWLAFLTPTEPEALPYLLPGLKDTGALKEAALRSFEHPREFLRARGPLHRSSDCATLALLEILYGLQEKKVSLPEERYREWLEVANHFGLWRLRYALEDSIFRTFDPENFALFESVVAKQMFIDAHLVQAIRTIVDDALKRANIKNFSIENRTKNIYGVYKKVALKQKSINDIYDIHGFRVLTSTPKDCYKAVDVLHHLWPHFPERYKDYIAKPKENGYQSIHTVVQSLEGKPIEFQVRTREMDVIAASGPANHADYKNTNRRITSNEPS